MTYPSEDEVARNMAFLADLTPEQVDPELVGLMRTLWQRCILNQEIEENGPATELRDDGVDQDTLLNVIRKAALESLIAALVTLNNAGLIDELAPSVYHGDESGMDGQPFNY
jgi:hypothetical protein